MVDTFRIKRGDTYPYFAGQILDSNGSPYNLDGHTCKFIMAPTPGSTVVVNSGCEVTNSGSGLFEYRWGANDTSGVGLYFAEIQVTSAASGTFTVPTDNSLRISVTQDMGD